MADLTIEELEAGLRIFNTPASEPLSEQDRELLARFIDAYQVGMHFQLSDWVRAKIAARNAEILATPVEGVEA